MIEIFLFAFAVLNASISDGQNIPLEVTVSPLPEIASGSSAAESAEEGSATPATPPIPGIAIDAATITGMAAVAGGAYAAFRKSSGRDNAVTDTTVRVADSLKATDYGSAETASILSDALQSLSKINAEMATALQTTAQRAQNNAKVWNKDNKEYYENLPIAPRPGELEGDKVKTKLAQVNKVTEPTPDP